MFKMKKKNANVEGGSVIYTGLKFEFVNYQKKK